MVGEVNNFKFEFEFIERRSKTDAVPDGMKIFKSYYLFSFLFSFTVQYTVVINGHH